MIVVPDKQTVRTAFSRAADGYDRWAEHHRIIADRLCELLPRVAHRVGSAVRTAHRTPRGADSAAGNASTPRGTGVHGPHSGPYAAGHPRAGRILELGCGTGILTTRLRAAYAASTITAIDIAPGMVEFCRRRWPGDALARFLLADAESFVPDQRVDLIVSSCMLQWLTDRQAAIRRFASLLAGGGHVALAVPVGGTLGELAASYRTAVGRDMPELDFWPAEQYVRLFEHAGLSVVHNSVEDVCVYYREPLQVLTAVKCIGAALSNQPGTESLLPSALKALLEHYRRDYLRRYGTCRCDVPRSVRGGGGGRPVMKGVFITGTDTGVGKTIVAAGLLRACRRRGLPVVPMKPVQTGCRHDGDVLRAPDLEFCLNAAGLTPAPEEREWMCPYMYEPACSPHLAARMAGNPVNIDRIAAAAEALGAAGHAVIAEGAGGVLVPLDERHTMLDLMHRLNWPVVLVARGQLGTINHTLLSLRAIRSAGVEVLGVVLCDADRSSRDFVRTDNPRAIERYGEVVVLGEIPYLPQLAEAPAVPAAWTSFEAGLPHLPAVLERLT